MSYLSIQLLVLLVFSVFLGSGIFLLNMSSSLESAGEDVYQKSKDSESSEENLRRLALYYPNSTAPLIFLCVFYSKNGKFSEMREASELIIKKFPRYIEGYMAKSGALRGLNDYERAACVMTRAVQLFPKEIRAWSERNLIARESGDMQEMLHLSRVIRLKFPDEPGAWAEEAHALIVMKRFSEAELVLFDAMGRFPTDAMVIRHYAKLAEVQNEWELAANRWAILRKHHDMLIDGYIKGYDALRNCGKVTEAKKLIETAAVIFNKDPIVAQRKADLV